MDLQIARWIYRHLSDKFFGGGECPPGANQGLDFGEPDDSGNPMLVARTYCNDGFDLWLGYHDKWKLHFSAKDARKLAWFILWNWWAKSMWFGLRRWIWYKALERICEETRKWSPIRQ